MDEDQLAARAAALRTEISEHNRRYHAEDAPTITDADYDELVRELRAIEERFPELAITRFAQPLRWARRPRPPSTRWSIASR